MSFVSKLKETLPAWGGKATLPYPAERAAVREFRSRPILARQGIGCAGCANTVPPARSWCTTCQEIRFSSISGEGARSAGGARRWPRGRSR